MCNFMPEIIHFFYFESKKKNNNFLYSANTFVGRRFSLVNVQTSLTALLQTAKIDGFLVPNS